MKNATVGDNLRRPAMPSTAPACDVTEPATVTFAQNTVTDPPAAAAAAESASPKSSRLLGLSMAERAGLAVEPAPVSRPLLLALLTTVCDRNLSQSRSQSRSLLLYRAWPTDLRIPQSRCPDHYVHTHPTTRTRASYLARLPMHSAPTRWRLRVSVLYSALLPSPMTSALSKSVNRRCSNHTACSISLCVPSLQSQKAPSKRMTRA